jgi:lipopolysaccharide/colanic/teichoic acid biosynthesis glycosyltransferase
VGAARRFREEAAYEYAKRLLDLTLAFLILPLALSLIAACALATRLDSPGPVFLRQHHTGKGGRRFKLLKLRTTITDLDSPDPERSPLTWSTPELQALADPRVTRVGRVLRATHLDELPELLNILRGEMSLVGPRPTQYSADTGRLWHTALLEVKPGLTGLATLVDDDELTLDERRRLDIAYVRNRAVSLDVKILLRTLGIIIRSARYLIKRFVDIVLASALMLVLAPLILWVVVAIRWTSPGPVLFRQVRVGKDAYPFKMFKFRTMRVDAEEVLANDPVLHAAYVANDYKLPLALDPRITPLGRFLRRTSLDELPQLLNVLRGDMSLVGPRPIVPCELVHYGNRAKKFLSALPGVTGAWQVEGRSDLHYPERCEVELQYVRSWSLSLDCMILIRTVGAVVSGRGAT